LCQRRVEGHVRKTWEIYWWSYILWY
jgi:hypothetical protein